MANIIRKENDLRSKLHSRWMGMKYRCNNENNALYPRYGGRGIKVCKEWEDFSTFFHDMKDGYEWGLQIDRIDNNGNYSKDNCRWVTAFENGNNRDVLGSALPDVPVSLTCLVTPAHRLRVKQLSEALGCSQSEVIRGLIENSL